MPELEELVDKEIRALISLSLCSGVELGLDCLSSSTLGSPSSNLFRDFPGMEQPSGFQWKLTDPIPCIQTQQGIGFEPSLLQENTTALETLPNPSVIFGIQGGSCSFGIVSSLRGEGIRASSAGQIQLSGKAGNSQCQGDFQGDEEGSEAPGGAKATL